MVKTVIQTWGCVVTIIVVILLVWTWSMPPRITALETQLAEQHEADYVVCDLCGQEFEQHGVEAVCLNGGWIYTSRRDSMGVWVYEDAHFEYYSDAVRLCPRCVKALKAQLPDLPQEADDAGK